MEDIFVDAFLKILNMSMTASYIILAVIIARLLLRRAPKKYSYALWLAAAFRLVCPVSFKSVISIFSLKPFNVTIKDSVLTEQGAEIVHIPENIGLMDYPEINTGIEALDPVVNESLPAATPMWSANPLQIWEFFGMLLWVSGIVILLAVSLISLWRLCRRLRTATLLEGNVWQSEKVQSPFIIGLFKAKIYIPYGLEGAPLGYVLAHERAHIKRGDHVVRTIAYLVLCLHWFNPLVWIAFWLMGRDMELSCDEKVLGSMGDKAEYSETLLSFASPRRFPTPTPLAFGESSVGRRIKNALKWKRPRLWVSIIALVLCVMVIAACAANPKTEDDGWFLAGRWVSVECVYNDGLSSVFPYGDNDRVYDIHAEGDGVRVFDRRSGGFLGGFGIREWQDFPYSDEEWEDMFLAYDMAFSAPLSELYDEILYMGPNPNLDLLPLHSEEEHEAFIELTDFFMAVDGELRYVSTRKDAQGKLWVSRIDALQKEDELGVASFTYPDGTSNEPGMEIEFSDGVKSVYAFCDEGSVGMYVQGELFSWGDGSITVPGLDSLFWCPVQKGADYQRPQPYGLAENDCIRLVVDFDDLSSISCSIYVDYSDGVYTLRPVGEGVYLEQKGEGKALLSFDRVYAHPDSTATDIPAEVPAGSPWELLTGLIEDEENILMVRGGGFDRGETAEETKTRLLDALRQLRVQELVAGRGKPWHQSLTLQIPTGDLITLGYCGDFVELQLSDRLKNLYPAEVGVWEIHNEALTELMASLQWGGVTNFVYTAGPATIDEPLSVSFDVPGADKIDWEMYTRGFPAEGRVLSSTISGTMFSTEESLLWLPRMENNGTIYLAEIGDVLFTVWKDGKFAEGSLSCMGSDKRDGPGTGAEMADYAITAGGNISVSTGADEKELIVSIPDSAFKSAPHEWAQSLEGDDFSLTFYNYEGESGDFRDELAKALNSLQQSQLSLEREQIIPELELSILQGDSIVYLSYGQDRVSLRFEGGELYEKYGSDMGVWHIENEKLNACFKEILMGHEEEYGILSGKPEDIKSIYIQKPQWQTDGSKIFLDDEREKQFLELLLSGKKKAEPYPAHLVSMQASTAYTITITYENGAGDLIYAGDQSTAFHRYIGTHGPDGDPGYVLVISEEARELVDSWME